VNKWILGILASGLVFLLAWLFLPAPPSLRRAPIARIYVDPPAGEAPLTVWLVNAGAQATNEELQLEWTVDGAAVSNKGSFYHKLETAGPHTITLKVTDQRGASSTDSVTVTTVAPPERLLVWSMAGPVKGMNCVQVYEPEDPDPWADNYLCSSRDLGIQWSAAGSIAGMRCTQITEPREPAKHGWTDNYLCVPESSPLELEWSNRGRRIEKKKCLAIREFKDRDGWRRTALCYSLNSTDEAQKPAE